MCPYPIFSKKIYFFLWKWYAQKTIFKKTNIEKKNLEAPKKKKKNIFLLINFILNKTILLINKYYLELLAYTILL